MAMEGMRMVVAGVAVFAIGVVAGLMVGTGMAGWTAKGLPEENWTMRFQMEDALFAKTMPPLFLGTLAALAVASGMSQGSGRVWFGVAAGLMVVVLAITVGLEVPLNKEIQGWTAGAAPVEWSVVRDRWLHNHVARTVVGMGAFAAAVAGLLRR